MEPTAIRETASPEAAAALLKSLVRPGDVILVKGSHALRMDRIVATLTEA